MKIYFDYEHTPLGQGVLEKLSSKYLTEYRNSGGKEDLNKEGYHYFWNAMEKKFNMKINFKGAYVEFGSEKDYLAFVLKEM